MNRASLPMYDMPEVAGALDTLWSALARKLADDDGAWTSCVISF